MKKIISKSVIETENIAEKISSFLKGDEVIALFGDLGAGKTAFTRGLARGLGFCDGVSSPTFAIINEYNARYSIYHFDMYRIKSEDDLYSTGYYDYLHNGIVVIEWSENIEEYLEKDCIKISLSYGKKENEREIKIYGMEEYEDFIS
ncbi:MAG: tRNA (adenosine(37)-N6)-threonylcarbamoyltransferase complex ATPase subunit type 1 TsaE [Oscillospiraceae bacterium]|nr:tRNA (adenosine(37)-N6)-threonylcarbamoyltransferase complex ATPase subunit type 1 TsaE [Candidatus Ruminococcus equi]